VLTGGNAQPLCIPFIIVTVRRVVAPLLSLALCASVCASDEVAAPHDNLPAQLPAAITRELGSVAFLEFPEEPEYGSAVQILQLGNESLYLSAGHPITNGDNTPKPGSREIGGIQLQTVNNSPTYNAQVGSSVLYQIGTTVIPTAISASYIENDTGATPDIALLEAPTCPDDRPKQKLPEIARTRAPIGSYVFFVNYEPVTNKFFRDPSQINTLPKLKNDVYAQPAIYGGIVTGYQSNGDYIVRDGLKNYGAIYQTVSRPGASGGATLNDAGDLIGVSIETSTRGGNPYTIVQLVTQGLVQRLKRELVGVSKDGAVSTKC